MWNIKTLDLVRELWKVITLLQSVQEIICESATLHSLRNNIRLKKVIEKILELNAFGLCPFIFSGGIPDLMLVKVSKFWLESIEHTFNGGILLIKVMTNNIDQLPLIEIEEHIDIFLTDGADLEQISGDIFGKLNSLFFSKLIDLKIDISEFCCSFKILFKNCLINQLFDLFFYRSCIPLKEVYDDIGVFSSSEFWFCASSLAEPKIIIRAELFLIKLLERAGSILNNLSEILKKFFEFSSIVFWSDIDCSIVDFFPCDQNLWNRMFCKFNIGICIRSFEHIIERRKMLFDEVGF